MWILRNIALDYHLKQLGCKMFVTLKLREVININESAIKTKLIQKKKYECCDALEDFFLTENKIWQKIEFANTENLRTRPWLLQCLYLFTNIVFKYRSLSYFFSFVVMMELCNQDRV